MAITAGFWLCGIVLHPLAQPPDGDRVQRQIDRMTTQQQAASIQLENRLTKLETKMDGIERLLWGVTGAMVALAVGNLWSLLVGRKKAVGT